MTRKYFIKNKDFQLLISSHETILIFLEKKGTIKLASTFIPFETFSTYGLKQYHYLLFRLLENAVLYTFIR